ncbi:MAG: bifunctional folylpolyglutamate synthase/dihydrofolate synthase [Defluviitaleaceae bacterium]|nr:bifunctional folylpolyglutamate synthase/dihydrofolate synthase [Defluviitaleaceae bacterium]
MKNQMTYDQALEYLNSRQMFGTKMGLERIAKLMQYLGDPQKQLKFVHIAGTNGKGSTSSFVYHIIKEAGYKVGLFTSPYIQRFNERIQVGEQEITNDEIVQILTQIRDIIEQNWSKEEGPTWFEVLTAMCFVYFKNQNCDIVVLEVGLGGDLDSTNVIDKSEVSVITTISYDHMEVLGNTLEEIAAKKAGIIKQNGTVVVYPQGDSVTEVIKDKCNKQDATMNLVNPINIVPKTYDLQGQTFSYKNIDYSIKMLGQYQVYNASVAIEAVLQLSKMEISVEHIQKGLEKATWPGRMELLSKEPLFLLDGAHNIQGATTLVSNMRILFPNRKFIFIVGFLAHKEYEKMLAQVMPMAKHFITVTPVNEKAMKAQDLAVYIESKGGKATPSSSVSGAIDLALEMAKTEEGNCICAFGSLYYIGMVRDYFGLR